MSNIYNINIQDVKEVKNMEYFELVCTMILNEDIYYDGLNETLGKFINKAMTYDDDLKKLHGSTGYKFYVYDLLYPRESDKNYKKGRIYIFKIRSINDSILIKMKKTLPMVNGENMKILSVELKRYNKIHITEIYTVTPAVLTENNKYWAKGDSLELLETRIQANLEKKYQDYFKEELNVKESFIQGIEIKNNKPIGVKYKNTRIMGFKIKLLVKDDVISQKLATMALATGLLEKNSSNGMGFCVAK
jgi:CRISPR-associated endoribonuclease Cas6